MNDSYTFVIHWSGAIKDLDRHLKSGLRKASKGKYRHGKIAKVTRLECKNHYLCYCMELIAIPYIKEK